MPTVLDLICPRLPVQILGRGDLVDPKLLPADFVTKHFADWLTIWQEYEFALVCGHLYIRSLPTPGREEELFHHWTMNNHCGGEKRDTHKYMVRENGEHLFTASITGENEISLFAPSDGKRFVAATPWGVIT